jgi:hypothetical protein
MIMIIRVTAALSLSDSDACRIFTESEPRFRALVTVTQPGSASVAAKVTVDAALALQVSSSRAG